MKNMWEITRNVTMCGNKLGNEIKQVIIKQLKTCQLALTSMDSVMGTGLGFRRRV